MSIEAPGSLGAVIRQRRTELGWSQEELANRLSGDGDDVRQSDISRLECGRIGLPRRRRLERIASVLGLSLGDLLLRSGWALAEHGTPEAIPPDPEEPAEDLPSSSCWSAPLVASSPAGCGALDAAVRLRSAIDSAAATRAEAERILLRAHEVMAYAANPRTMRQRRCDEARERPGRNDRPVVGLTAGVRRDGPPESAGIDRAHGEG